MTDVKAMRKRIDDVSAGDHFEVWEVREMLDELEALRERVAELEADEPSPQEQGRQYARANRATLREMFHVYEHLVQTATLRGLNGMKFANAAMRELSE